MFYMLFESEIKSRSFTFTNNNNWKTKFFWFIFFFFFFLPFELALAVGSFNNLILSSIRNISTQKAPHGDKELYIYIV